MAIGSENFEVSGIRSGGATLWMIAALALVLRWVHLFIVKDSDLVQVLIIDSAFYHKWAVAISQGEPLGHHTFFMSPLYPYLTGLVYAILGAVPARMLALQGLIGVATVLLTYRWGARLAGRTVGLVTAGLAAVYAPFIFYETTLLTATLILFLSAIILNLSETVLKGRRRVHLWLLGGVIGLSALARPLVLIFVPLLYLVFMLDDRTSWLKRSLLVTAGVFVLLIPIGVRNFLVGGEFTLTTSSAGMNFYVGNNPEATGLYWEAPFLSSVEPQYEDEDYRRAASEAVGRELTTREAGSYWFERSLDWIVHQPLDYLKLLGTKVFYFWNRAEFANNISIYYGKRVSPIIGFNPFCFWLIGPLGLGGLILLCLRRGWKRARIAILWVAVYFVGGCLFFISSEYRLPALLPLLLGSAYLLVEIVRSFRERRFEPALRLIALGLVFVPLTNFRTDFIHRGENPRMDIFNIGNTLLKQNKPREAVSKFQQALEVDPYFAEGLMRLAEAYSRAGMTEKAIEIGRQAGLERPESILEIIKVHAMNEAYALLNEGNFKGAMDEFAFAGFDSAQATAETTRVSRLTEARTYIRDGNPVKSLELLLLVYSEDKTPDPMLLHNIASIYWRIGALDSAEHYAAEALTADSMSVPTVYLMARILNSSGRWEEAERLIMRVNPNVSGSEDKLNAVRAQMDSLTDLGQWEQALEAYGTYGRLGFMILPEDKIRLGRLHLEIGNLEQALMLLTEAEDAGFHGADLYYNKSRSLAGLARTEEAVGAAQRSLAVVPDFVAARIFLTRLYIAQGRMTEAWHELEAISHLEIIDIKLANEFESLVDSLKAL